MSEGEIPEPEVQEIQDMPDIDGDIDPDIDGDIEFLIDPDNIGDDEDGVIAIESKNLDGLQKIITGDFQDMPDSEPELDEEDLDEMDEPHHNRQVISKATLKTTTKLKVHDWTCTSCYVKVAPAQFGSAANPACPQGQSICPAVDKFF